MKVLQTLSGIAILLCPSSHAFQLASPTARVPLGLHMTLSPVHALKLHRNKGLKAPRSSILKKSTRRKMSQVSEIQESDDGFWNKVRSSTLCVCALAVCQQVKHSFLTNHHLLVPLQIKSVIPPAEERKKLFPLGLMFFCILFNYTILRDTKDVLLLTAPGSGAEVIPFIKTYCNLPAAIVRSYFMSCVLKVSEEESFLTSLSILSFK